MGLSRYDSESTKTANAGTPPYWAPEVQEGRYSNLADVYSIGVIALVLREGRLPKKDEG